MTNMTDTHLTLDAVARELVDNLARAQALRAGHDAEALVRRPSANAWSAADCIDHLQRTTDQYRLPLADLIARHRQGGRTSDDPHIRPGRFAGWFIRQASPTNPRKLPAPRAFRVDFDRPASLEAFDRFTAGQSDLQTFIESARGLELNRGKLPSPITRLIRFTIGETFLLLARHQARHLNQAEAAVDRTSTRPIV